MIESLWPFTKPYVRDCGNAAISDNSGASFLYLSPYIALRFISHSSES